MQDTARSFGSSKADSDRYRIFMEATQFDVIIETLKLSEVDVETMKSRKKGLDKDIKVSRAFCSKECYRSSNGYEVCSKLLKFPAF